MSSSYQQLQLAAGLREAVIANKLDEVKKLLDAGCPQIADKDGNTLLHLAAQAGHSKIVALLLKNNADRAAKNKAGDTPVEFALGEETLHEFIKYKTDDKDSCEYSSCLMPCVDKEQYATATALLKAGAQPNKYQAIADKSTVLHKAIKKESTRENLAFIKVLLEHKAYRGFLRWADNGERFTPIHDAARDNKWEVIKLFAEYKTNEIDSYHYSAALLFAVRHNKTDIAIKLLETGELKSWSSADEGYTCTHWAVHNKNLPLFKLLLQHGFNPYEKIQLSNRDRAELSACELATNSGLFDFVLAIASYKTSQTAPGIFKDCIAELNAYIKTWRRTNHDERADSLLKALNLLDAKPELDIQQAIRTLDKAIEAFTVDRTIEVNKNTPHYARPPKSYVKDEYNKIIENYASKLQKFKPLEKKEEPAAVAPLNPALGVDSDRVIKFDVRLEEQPYNGVEHELVEPINRLSLFGKTGMTDKEFTAVEKRKPVEDESKLMKQEGMSFGFIP